MDNDCYRDLARYYLKDTKFHDEISSDNECYKIKKLDYLVSRHYNSNLSKEGTVYTIFLSKLSSFYGLPIYITQTV